MVAVSNIEQWQAIGRRKRAIARVYLRRGDGAITINRRDSREYFGRDALHFRLAQPLKLTENEQSFDILINVCGGGKAGQADAIMLAIARALEKYDPKLRPSLKKAGLLTRDARIVERKKYGQPGARKRFQFSKR